MAPPFLSRLLFVSLVGVTHVMAHPVSKDNPAVSGSVNVTGSPDLKWKPKSEEHDHRQAHVYHGNEKSSTIVYQKITVTSGSKDVSKDKPDKNGDEKSTKTEHPTEFSSKHDKTMGKTQKHKDLERQEDESIKNEKNFDIDNKAKEPISKNKVSKNDKREAHKDGKPLSPGDSSAIQPEFDVSDVTIEQWENLTEDKKSMKMLDKAKKKHEKLSKKNKEEADKTFKELLRQALAQSDKKAQERTNKPRKPNKHSKFIQELMKEKPGKPHKAELAPVGGKGVEKKKTIGERCAVPWWVYLIVEMKKKEKMKKEKKKMEEMLKQPTTPPSAKFRRDSNDKTRSGLNDKEQDSDAKRQTENKESKQKIEAQTNTTSERPKRRPVFFWGHFLYETKDKKAISSQPDSKKSKDATARKKNQEKIYVAPGKTEHLDKAKLSIETEETNEKTKESVKSDKTPHQEKNKEINRDSKAEIQNDLNKNPLTARSWIPPHPPRPLTVADRKERELLKWMQKFPKLAAKIKKKHRNYLKVKDKGRRP